MGNEQTQIAQTVDPPSSPLQSIDAKYNLRQEVPILRIEFSFGYNEPYLQWFYSRNGLTFTMAKMYVRDPKEKDDQEVPSKTEADLRSVPRVSAPLITGYWVREDINEHEWRMIDPQQRITQQFHIYKNLVDMIENTNFPFDVALIIGEYVSIEPVRAWVHVGGGN